MNRFLFIRSLSLPLFLVTVSIGEGVNPRFADAFEHDAPGQPVVHFAQFISQTPEQDSLRFIPIAEAAPTRGRARGGASRGNCSAFPLPLAALVPLPPSEEDSALPANLTTLAQPTFWFYVPAALSPDYPAEFLLLDGNGDYVYTVLLDSTDAPGVISVDLPPSVSLDVEGRYHWIFQMACDDGNPIDIWGEVQRIPLDSALQAQLEQATGRDRAALYASHGIWQDALTILAEMHRTAPDDPSITADWVSLLGSAHLEALANYPVLPCCDAE